METILTLIGIAVLVGAYLYFVLSERKILEDVITETGKVLLHYEKEFNQLADMIQSIKEDINSLKES